MGISRAIQVFSPAKNKKIECADNACINGACKISFSPYRVHEAKIIGNMPTMRNRIQTLYFLSISLFQPKIGVPQLNINRMWRPGFFSGEWN